MQPEIKRIIRKRCDELGISYAIGDEIYMSLFSWIVGSIREGDKQSASTYKTAYIGCLGTLVPRDNLDERFQKNREYYEANKHKWSKDRD